MLPPLRSSSGSNSSFPNHTSLTSSSHLVTEASYKVHFAGTEGDPNSSTANKLNVLLLAGRERMADHLAMLADAIGAAIDLPRGDGESDGDYATRLAEALKKLTPAQRADVERHLNQVVQGLRLRFLFEAFNNPTGPEAARIVAYIETARYKDRDLVARSVVTSYRQHGGEAAIQDPATTAQANKTAAAAETQTSLATEAGGSEAMARAVSETAEVQEGDEVMRRELAEGYIVETEPESLSDTVAATARDTSGHAEGPDARSLQALLKKAFEGGESGDAAIEAKATARLLADAESEMILDIATGLEAIQDDVAEFDLDSRFSGDSGLRPASRQPGSPLSSKLNYMPGAGHVFHHDSAAGEAALHDGAGSERKIAAQPRINIFAPNPIREDDYRPTLFILKGWTEIVETAGEGAESAEAGTAKANPQTSITNGGTALDDDATMAGRIMTDADAAAPYERHAAPAIADGAGDEADALRRGDDTQAEQAASKTLPQQAVERQALAQLSLTGREGIPHPYVGYPPAQDMLALEETEEERRRFRDDGEPPGGDHEQSDDQPEQQAAADEQAEDQGETPNEDGAEQRAYDLYQRMAGLS